MRSTFDLFRGGNGRLPSLPPDPVSAGRYLLSLDEREASQLFQRLPEAEQLSVIEATADPYDREELYYLVLDATELVRASRVEGLLEIINTGFGTGLACGILSAVSPEQFSQMFERTVVKNGVVDRDTVSLWVAELTELESDELTGLLAELDVELLAELLMGRVELPRAYQGMMVDGGLVGLEELDFGEDEQARLIAELLWASDPDLFMIVLRALLTENEPTAAVEEGLTEEEAVSSMTATEQAQQADISTFDLDRVDDLLPPPKKSN